MSETRVKNTWSPTRRTLVKGAAWTAPVVAVGVAAPAFAVSPCTPQLSFSQSSCKCPGQSQSSEPWGYYLQFCVTLANGCDQGPAQTFQILSVAKKNPGSFVSAPNACFPATLPGAVTPVGSCTAATYRFTSDNSANFLEVTYALNGDTAHPITVQLAAPPDCSKVSVEAAKNCDTCNP